MLRPIYNVKILCILAYWTGNKVLWGICDSESSVTNRGMILQFSFFKFMVYFTIEEVCDEGLNL